MDVNRGKEYMLTTPQGLGGITDRPTLTVATRIRWNGKALAEPLLMPPSPSAARVEWRGEAFPPLREECQSRHE